jgi:hypothetical protein
LEKLKEGGVEFIMNTQVKGAKKIKQYFYVTQSESGPEQGRVL